jgi:hypothetical protein
VDRIQFFQPSLQQVVDMAALKQLLEQTAALVAVFRLAELLELETHLQLHHLKEIMAVQMEAFDQALEEVEQVRLAALVAGILLALAALVLQQVLLEHLPPTLVAVVAASEIVELLAQVAQVAEVQGLILQSYLQQMDRQIQAAVVAVADPQQEMQTVQAETVALAS